jgi:hypothetical protein
MKILVDTVSRIVLMAGDNLTDADINAQKASWCFDYSTLAFTIYTVSSLPLGFESLRWKYTDEGAFIIIPEYQHIVDTLITSANTIPVLSQSNISFRAVLKDDSTFVSATISWDKVATATSYEVRYNDGTANYYITVLDSGSATTTTNITGLLTSTSYTFNVRAMTQWGLTDWSANVTAISPASLKNVPDLIKRLNPEVLDSKIVDYLSGKTSLIDIIDTSSMVFELGVVGPGIAATYTDALKQASSEMNLNRSMIAALTAELSGLTVATYDPTITYDIGQMVVYAGQTYQCLVSSTGNLPTNVDYWIPISGMLDMVTLIQQNLDEATGTWESTALTLTGDVDALNNPTTGRVTLAETEIAQNGANLSLQGTAITGPLALVIGGVVEPGVVVETVADVEGIDTRVSKTKIDLDSANNTITLQASAIDNLTGDITDAFIAIDGNTAAIALRATKNELSSEVQILSDAIGLRVTSEDYESKMTLLDNAIGLRVTSEDFDSEILLLDDLIGLKLNATGTVGPGLAIAWQDESHTKSIIRVQTDLFQVGNDSGTGFKNVFSTGNINGVSTVGINGNLIVDGSIDARSIVTDSLIVGTNVALGTAQTAANVTTIIDGTITTDYINALGITADYVTAGISITSPVVNGGSITGSSINIGSGKMTVDVNGNVEMRSVKVMNSDGSVLLQSGGTLDFSKISGATKPANNATVGATIGTNLSGKMTKDNISTWIADLAVGNAQIANAAVDTLQIAGNAVTVPVTSLGTILSPVPAEGSVLTSLTMDAKGGAVTLIASCYSKLTDGMLFISCDAPSNDPTARSIYEVGGSLRLYTSTALPTIVTASHIPTDGIHTYRLVWSESVANASSWIQKPVLTAIGSKR